MEVKITQDDGKTLAIEFEGIDRSVAELIRAKLFEMGIEFASVELDHPQVGKPRLVVKDKNAKQAVKKAVESIRKEVDELQSLVAKEK